ncbi:MAG: succinate dehydrogenase [Archaeoglobaceae archaeon]|uniref:Succinate dehydrogenase n=1 Tax=Archaeoglobus fulgidus TaxID=2234 RepID=A0A7J3M3Y5_ARCFL
MRGFEPFAWIFQAVTGIVMVFLITAHFLATHANHELLSYETAVSRLGSFEYKVFYFFLLLFVTFHAFNGLRAIILDTEGGMRRRKAVNALILVIALVAFFYGAFLLSKF